MRSVSFLGEFMREMQRRDIIKLFEPIFRDS